MDRCLALRHRSKKLILLICGFFYALYAIKGVVRADPRQEVGPELISTSRKRLRYPFNHSRFDELLVVLLLVLFIFFVGAAVRRAQVIIRVRMLQVVTSSAIADFAELAVGVLDLVVEVLLDELGQAQLVEVDGLLLDLALGFRKVKCVSRTIKLIDLNTIFVASVYKRLLPVHIILPVLEDPVEVLELFARQFWHLEAFFDVDPSSVSLLSCWRRLLSLIVHALALVKLDQVDAALDVEVLDHLARLAGLAILCVQDLLKAHERAHDDRGALIATLAFRVERARVDVLYTRLVRHLVEHVLERALHLLVNAWYRALVLRFVVNLLASI